MSGTSADGIDAVLAEISGSGHRMLAGRVGVGEWLTHEDFGLANAAKEALALAILAHETLRGRPGNVPSATDAQRAVVLGKIVPS